MPKDKETELQKYLDKKKRQKSRDDIMNQIAQLTKTKTNNGSTLIKKKIRKMEKLKDKLVTKDDNSASEADIFEDIIRPIVNIQEDENSAHDAVVNNDYNDVNSVEDVANLFPTQTVNKCCDEPEKQQILALNEKFNISTFPRTSEVIYHRKSMEIIYEEAEIVSKIKYSIITFIQGSTGCGKTTQIPQFLFENGLAFDKMVAVTQPRRFSAISISNRINYEANTDISGYKIKYENNIKEHTRIKVLTEGVLLREIQLDFLLTQYSVVVLDEVHERSINMDILIGLLSRIVRIRFEQGNPLRLILMSATMDPNVFRSVLGKFQLINLQGKKHPVSVFFEDKTPEDHVDAAYKKILAILDAEKKYLGSKRNKVGDEDMPIAITNDSRASILVFLTGKEDIYTLKKRLDLLKRPTIVLPLHSGLNKSEQAQVYDTFPQRKIILATNIAETSITIDDVVFVIDCGKVKRRISDGPVVMYKTIFISKSSSKQRMGRAGRTGPGVCYRIYSGDTYESFSEHIRPQILVESIDSIVLQLKCMGIKNIFGFPFIDRPEENSIEESLKFLESLGGLDSNWNVTKLGKKMSRYPVKPRYARFIAACKDNTFTNLSHIAAIVSILSSGVELKRDEATAEYFKGAFSDLIVLLRIFFAYLNAKNRKRFATRVNISFDKLDEIRKMTEYLLRIADTGVNLETALSRDDEIELWRQIYYLFADHLAVANGASYIFEENEVSISNDSIDVEHKNAVFEYIVCGSKKVYIKNVTIVPPLSEKR